MNPPAVGSAVAVGEGSAQDHCRQALAVLIEPGAVAELRVLKTRQKTVSGYFDNPDHLAAAAKVWDGKAPAVYVTLNPVNPALLARSANKVKGYAEHTTSDSDILRRRWLPIDLDPVRPAGVSSTDEEHVAALARAREVRDWLAGQGWPASLLADSGNGAHLLYPIDIPNDAESADLVRGSLEALAFRFSDDSVTVDEKVFNAARIWKFYGTLACKGDSTVERPHRRARLLEVPDRRDPVPVDLLHALAAIRPKVAEQVQPVKARSGAITDLDTWLEAHGIEVYRRGSWGNGGRRWVIRCPWNSEHTDRAAYVVQLPGGAIDASCHHNSCAGKAWRDLRELVEPGWRDRRGQDGPAADAEAGESDAIPWPDPPAGEAFHGLAGEFVRLIEPHTEADPVALLVQFLVEAGNLIGRGPHFMAEADQHHLNLFTVLVGQTAKGRKGTSAGQVRRVMRAVDETWTTQRVQAGLSSGEGLIWAVRDPIKKTEAVREKGKPTGEYREVIADLGVEDKRLLTLEAEFASVLRVLGRDGNTLSAIIRQAWDTGDLRIMTKNSPATATGAHISIIGHITQDELRRYLDSTETGNGFANRFLWVCVRRSKFLPEGGQAHTLDFAPLVKRLEEAVELGRTVKKIMRDNEARTIWCHVYPELSEGKPGLLGAVTSRAEAQVMRLACLYALLDLSDIIRKEHLLAALALWGYVEASAKYIFGDAVGDPVADEILRVLRAAPDGKTRTAIRDLFQRNKSGKEIGRALGALTEQGIVRRENVPGEDTGRSVERWFAVRTTTT